jgi:hypothetical protein
MTKALQARVEQALHELPLSEAEIAAVAPQLAAGFLRLRGGMMSASSAFFDFRAKITTVARHFAPYGPPPRRYDERQFCVFRLPR